jgi:hypothetical protein
MMKTKIKTKRADNRAKLKRQPCGHSKRRAYLVPGRRPVEFVSGPDEDEALSIEGSLNEMEKRG